MKNEKRDQSQDLLKDSEGVAVAVKLTHIDDLPADEREAELQKLQKGE